MSNNPCYGVPHHCWAQGCLQDRERAGAKRTPWDMSVGKAWCWGLLPQWGLHLHEIIIRPQKCLHGLGTGILRNSLPCSKLLKKKSNAGRQPACLVGGTLVPSLRVRRDLGFSTLLPCYFVIEQIQAKDIFLEISNLSSVSDSGLLLNTLCWSLAIVPEPLSSEFWGSSIFRWNWKIPN